MFSRNSQFLFFSAYLGIVCQFFSVNAQQVDQALLDVRAKSVLNIRSMIAGVPVTQRSPLRGIESPIKRSVDPEEFYDHVLKQERSEVFKKLRKFGVNEKKIEDMRLAEKEKEELSVRTVSPSGSKLESKKRVRMPSAQLRQKARAVFSLFTDKPIQVTERKDPNSPAAADDKGVFLDSTQMEKVYAGKNEPELIISHETVHHLELHDSEFNNAEELLKKKYEKLTQPMEKHLFELSRWMEVAADVKGALRGGLPFVEGYQNFAQHLIKEEREVRTPLYEVSRTDSHPSNLRRFDQANLLQKELVLLKKAKKRKHVKVAKK